MSKNILGALCMVVSVTFFSLMDILVKVTDDYAVGQILFFRALFGFIPIIFLIPKNRLRDFYKTKKWSLHFYSFKKFTISRSNRNDVCGSVICNTT